MISSASIFMFNSGGNLLRYTDNSSKYKIANSAKKIYCYYILVSYTAMFHLFD